MRILLVEDDERIADALAEELSDQHYVVEVAYDGEAGWDLADSFDFDLILLDVMLPKIDGVVLCQKLRSKGNLTPILMLTARDTIGDRVVGLDAGADDYLVKPFDLQELSARIRALIRRGGASVPPVLTWGELNLDPSTYEVFHQGERVPLSPKEYSILELFLRHQRRVFSRAQIVEQLWSYEVMPEEATAKAHIRGLRQKLKAAGAPDDLIETVYGLGYRLKEISNESVSAS
ncbi:MAG: response regulator transcription factor [Leptolyngbyaceae cyanobacterium SL_1_1]|nr:response regulator transcription factor [Leptolyngbyaceae cyanobacterium RM1_1_2]NJO11043.1 response regulator transcription factor [Leptolyngbyaceae cyanobacterium SL_1_1]